MNKLTLVTVLLVCVVVTTAFGVVYLIQSKPRFYYVVQHVSNTVSPERTVIQDYQLEYFQYEVHENISLTATTGRFVKLHIYFNYSLTRNPLIHGEQPTKPKFVSISVWERNGNSIPVCYFDVEPLKLKNQNSVSSSILNGTKKYEVRLNVIIRDDIKRQEYNFTFFYDMTIIQDVYT